VELRLYQHHPLLLVIILERDLLQHMLHLHLHLLVNLVWNLDYLVVDLLAEYFLLQIVHRHNLHLHLIHLLLLELLNKDHLAHHHNHLL
jgi:hypothetical protein